MARFSTPEIQAAGLYRELALQEEQMLAEWLNPGWSHSRDEREYPRRRILEALRAGLTVNVPAGSLPARGRVGMPSRKSRSGLATIRPARAVVRPDDTITWSDDDWARLWLEENGL
jgi:hypothetical protein